MIIYYNILMFKQAPGVQKWNLRLLDITELLECKDQNGVILKVALMQKECPILR